MLEVLESRRVMAASVSLNPVLGAINIEGTDGPDQVVVSLVSLDRSGGNFKSKVKVDDGEGREQKTYLFDLNKVQPPPLIRGEAPWRILFNGWRTSRPPARFF